MDYWTGVLKVPLTPTSTSDCKVAVPLCLSTASKTLAGPRIQWLRDCLVCKKIAEILGSKFRGCVNAYVIEAPVFNGSFSVYKDFIPPVHGYGEPQSYSPVV
uniref:Uncharacterized protein n=1 Tax=Populus trichocarpa TaxID=3694 RepID=A0A2K1XQG8_POPTR